MYDNRHLSQGEVIEKKSVHTQRQSYGEVLLSSVSGRSNGGPLYEPIFLIKKSDFFQNIKTKQRWRPP